MGKKYKADLALADKLWLEGVKNGNRSSLLKGMLKAGGISYESAAEMGNITIAVLDNLLSGRTKNANPYKANIYTIAKRIFDTTDWFDASKFQFFIAVWELEEFYIPQTASYTPRGTDKKLYDITLTSDQFESCDTAGSHLRKVIDLACIITGETYFIDDLSDFLQQHGVGKAEAGVIIKSGMITNKSQAEALDNSLAELGIRIPFTFSGVFSKPRPKQTLRSQAMGAAILA